MINNPIVNQGQNNQIKIENENNISTIEWNKGSLIIGDPYDIFNYFLQFNNYEEFKNTLKNPEYINIGHENKTLVINNLSENGIRKVYVKRNKENGHYEDIYLI